MLELFDIDRFDRAGVVRELIGGENELAIVVHDGQEGGRQSRED